MSLLRTPQHQLHWRWRKIPAQKEESVTDRPCYSNNQPQTVPIKTVYTRPKRRGKNLVSFKASMSGPRDETKPIYLLQINEGEWTPLIVFPTLGMGKLVCQNYVWSCPALILICQIHYVHYP